MRRAGGGTRKIIKGQLLPPHLPYPIVYSLLKTRRRGGGQPKQQGKESLPLSAVESNGASVGGSWRLVGRERVQDGRELCMVTAFGLRREGGYMRDGRALLRRHLFIRNGPPY